MTAEAQSPDPVESPLATFGHDLQRLAAKLPATDDVVGLADVERRRRRRQRRTQAGLALAAAGVIGIVGVGLTLRSDDTPSDDLIVTATPPVSADAPATSATPIQTTDPTTTDPATAVPADPEVGAGEPMGQRVLDPVDVALIDVEPVDVSEFVPTIEFESPPGVPADFDVEVVWEFLVEWDGGFLLGRSEQVPPDGVELSPSEANELLGEQLVDALFADATATSSTAVETLRDAGHGDEIDAILDEHPDVLEAFFSFEWPFGLDAYFSPDGTAWEPFEIDVPSDLGRPVQVTAADGRIAILTMPFRNALPLVEPMTVWSTSDLGDWTAQTVPISDPFADASTGARQYVSAYVQADQLIAGDAGWGVETTTHFNIDVQAVVEERFGQTLSGYGLRIADGQARIDLDQPGQEEQQIVIELADLGLDGEQAALLERDNLLEVWTGDWGDADATRFDESLYYYGGMAAFDGGIATWTATQVTVVEPGSGATSTHRFPDADYSVSTVIGLGDQLVVYSNDANSLTALYRLDPQQSTWTPLTVDRLPEKMTVGHGSSESVLTLTSRSLPPTLATTETFEQGDHRYTAVYAQPYNSYEVRRISTGEIVVEESVDVREPGFSEGQLFEFRTMGSDFDTMTVVDPTTGDPIIEMDADDLAAMWESQTQLDGSPIPEWTADDFSPRDTWLMVPSADAWLLHDLPEPALDDDGNPRYAHAPVAAVSGDVVLVQTVDGWLRFELS
ncbi:hypothetical protein [Ilumatobacter coccineus]|uniref:Uncharacterized protein n=1 Tax=Ilumatobacter coccineus (strain NBRC 103263 / KCTC 29153 / YM16-304) TaxID=1313172 RepID=A0A6C7E2C8_ILUCY|nr:hypothetical protein [Ilumatobacter coccineus]BAN01237.1 hypothetical protein YM304_09230 [Ilumatobacter coccineus YM16-304]